MDQELLRRPNARDERDESETDPLLPSSPSKSSQTPQTPQSPQSKPSKADDLEEDLLELPQVVRETVSLTDDPSIPVVTFRYVVLSTLFVIPGAFIDTMNSFRTTSAAYSIFFVQIASHWCGKYMARKLPAKQVSLFGLYLFNLNPGPWSIKETALITITANSGATGNLATNTLALANLHFGEVVNPVTAICFMFAIVFIGYAYAAIAKQLILYDPSFTWPQALMQTALLKSQELAGNTALGHKQMRIFFAVLVFITLWQLLPEFIAPMLSSLAVLCWMFPYNSTINFIGSGLGGMGFMNFTLDWANITSSIMLYPYWIQVLQFVAFVINCWIFIPTIKFNSHFSDIGLMSNSIFTESGERYPTEKLLTDDLQFNSTAYAYYGPANLGVQRVWNIFFDYAAYISGIMWVVLFGYDQLAASFQKIYHNYKHNEGKNVNSQYTDRLNKLQMSYADVPHSWYIILFLTSFGTMMVIFARGEMFMAAWCGIIALILGSIIVTPLIWLYALSNFQLPIGTFNELFYGYLVQNDTSVHPASGSVFGSIAGDAWYRAQYHLECMKLGFYIHLPPKTIFLAQIYGELIGIPINYLLLTWVLKSKRDYLTEKIIDPLHQWTGQEIQSIHTNAIQYVILGPSRLFKHYPYLPFGFLLGILAPVALYYGHKKYPRAGFNFWNTTVLFSSMSHFYGNVSTGGLSKFIGGTVIMYYIFKYKFGLWKRYNYVLAAAFDTGYNLAILVIFLFASFLFQVKMPNWYMNNGDSVERCFAN